MLKSVSNRAKRMYENRYYGVPIVKSARRVYFAEKRKQEWFDSLRMVALR